MKKLRYIIAASIAALSLSASAYAVGNAVDDIGNGIGDAIDGAGNAIGDIMGREGDETTGADAGDVTTSEDTTADVTTAEITTAETTAADVVTAAETTAAVTTAPTIVAGTNNKNPGTGVAAGFTAVGAAAAGLIAMAAKKRR